MVIVRVQKDRRKVAADLGEDNAWTCSWTPWTLNAGKSFPPPPKVLPYSIRQNASGIIERGPVRDSFVLSSTPGAEGSVAGPTFIVHVLRLDVGHSVTVDTTTGK